MVSPKQCKRNADERGASISSLPLLLEPGQCQSTGTIALQPEVMHQGFLAAMRDPHLWRADFIDGAIELVPIGVIQEMTSGSSIPPAFARCLMRIHPEAMAATWLRQGPRPAICRGGWGSEHDLPFERRLVVAGDVNRRPSGTPNRS